MWTVLARVETALLKRKGIYKSKHKDKWWPYFFANTWHTYLIASVYFAHTLFPNMEKYGKFGSTDEIDFKGDWVHRASSSSHHKSEQWTKLVICIWLPKQSVICWKDRDARFSSAEKNRGVKQNFCAILGCFASSHLMFCSMGYHWPSHLNILLKETFLLNLINTFCLAALFHSF